MVSCQFCIKASKILTTSFARISILAVSSSNAPMWMFWSSSFAKGERTRTSESPLAKQNADLRVACNKTKRWPQSHPHQKNKIYIYLSELFPDPCKKNNFDLPPCIITRLTTEVQLEYYSSFLCSSPQNTSLFFLFNRGQYRRYKSGREDASWPDWWLQLPCRCTTAQPTAFLPQKDPPPAPQHFLIDTSPIASETWPKPSKQKKDKS